MEKIFCQNCQGEIHTIHCEQCGKLVDYCPCGSPIRENKEGLSGKDNSNKGTQKP